MDWFSHIFRMERVMSLQRMVFLAGQTYIGTPHTPNIKTPVHQTLNSATPYSAVIQGLSRPLARLLQFLLRCHLRAFCGSCISWLPILQQALWGHVCTLQYSGSASAKICAPMILALRLRFPVPWFSRTQNYNRIQHVSSVYYSPRFAQWNWFRNDTWDTCRRRSRCE